MAAARACLVGFPPADCDKRAVPARPRIGGINMCTGAVDEEEDQPLADGQSLTHVPEVGPIANAYCACAHVQ